MKHKTAYIVALAATICAASMSHAQSGQPMRTAVILPDVALLIHRPGGESSYKLRSTADDSVTLEEFGDRRTRLEIRQIPDKKCVFVSTSQEKDGFDVVQLDFTKFDGTYQLWEACRGPAAAPPENRCNSPVFSRFALLAPSDVVLGFSSNAGRLILEWTADTPNNCHRCFSDERPQ